MFCGSTIYIFLFFLLNLITECKTDVQELSDTGANENLNRLPIVFIFTVVEAVCKKGLPPYIRDSLNQAVYTNPNAEVIIATNIAECSLIKNTLEGMNNITVIKCKSRVQNYGICSFSF